VVSTRNMARAPVLRDYTDRMPGLADCGYEGAGHGILTPECTSGSRAETLGQDPAYRPTHPTSP